MVHSPQVGLGQKAAVGVHGEVLSYLHASFKRKRTALPFRDEPEPFELEKHSYGKAVIKERDVHVLGADTGCLEGSLSGIVYGVVDLIEVAERGEVLV